jgi:hypothetical protein
MIFGKPHREGAILMPRWDRAIEEKMNCVFPNLHYNDCAK